MRGRKAIPAKILELKGGTEHTHRPPRGEITPPSKIPTCPAHLSPVAKGEWKRVVKLLDDIGIMTELDRAALAAYCESYSRWVDATLRIRSMGDAYFKDRVVKIIKGEKVTLKSGVLVVNPYIRIQKDAQEQMIKTGTLLGMSPSSRASLSIPNQKPTKAADKTEAFRSLKHGKG